MRPAAGRPGQLYDLHSGHTVNSTICICAFGLMILIRKGKIVELSLGHTVNSTICVCAFGLRILIRKGKIVELSLVLNK